MPKKTDHDQEKDLAYREARKEILDGIENYKKQSK